jgi:hypothetical protein
MGVPFNSLRNRPEEKLAVLGMKRSCCSKVKSSHKQVKEKMFTGELKCNNNELRKDVW